MIENKEKREKGFNFMSDVFGGQFLSKMKRKKSINTP